MALDSSHGTLSPAIWLICITPILPHARVAPLGTDVTAGPGLAQQGLLQTRQGTWGQSSSRDAGAQAVTGSALGGIKPGTGSSSQVTLLSGVLWSWNPALHPSTLGSLTQAQQTPGQSQYSWEPKRREQCWD